MTKKKSPSTGKKTAKKKQSRKTDQDTDQAATVETTPVQSAARLPAFPIVGMGASAGGLEALEAFFKTMPTDTGVAIVLVVHLDPTHVSILPDILRKRTEMPVHQITDGMQVEQNNVYIIPPNKELAIFGGQLQLLPYTRSRGANMPIDCFFRSLAQDQGSNAVCIILSGTGTDGTLGARAIKDEAGMVMAQDSDSAKYTSMPESAVATGLVDHVLPPAKMATQLIKYTELANWGGVRACCPDQRIVHQGTSENFRHPAFTDRS